MNLFSEQKKEQGREHREGSEEPRLPDVSQTLRKDSPKVCKDTLLVLTAHGCPSHSFTCHTQEAREGVEQQGSSSAPSIHSHLT